MKRVIDWITVCLFFVLTALPGTQLLFGYSKEEKLHGVEENVATAAPRLHPEAFFAERFQRALEKWWDENIGFRGHLVRTDNQLNFDLFGEISASYASPLVVGLRNSLFEKLYIEHENGMGYVPEKRLQNLARRLIRVQELLKAKGIDFLLLISPSKASIYREDIPARYLDADAKKIPSNYERLLPMLYSAGVNLVDGRALLEKWKSESAVPVFPKGGTHWTQYTACRISAEVVKKLSSLSGEALVEPPCAPLETKSIPDPFDRDLADLANLWDPTPIYEQLTYPVLPEMERRPPLDSTRPHMLFIGGSFLWSLFLYLDAYQVYSERDMFYYYNRRFHFPGDLVSDIARKDLDWANDILKHKYIVVEVNEITMHTLGSGFLEDALGVLKGELNEEPQAEPHDPKASATDPYPAPPPSQP